MTSTPRSRRSVVDEEAILGGLRSGEGVPDFDYEDFEAGSTGQDRRGEDPDTPSQKMNSLVGGTLPASI